MASGREAGMPGAGSREARNIRAERAASAAGDELRGLLHDADPRVLLALLENPALDEPLLLLLLNRNDLPRDVLEEIGSRREWMKSYRVKLRVVGHPHTPRLLALPLIKQLYLFDQVKLSLQAGTPAELRRAAEETVVAKLEQIPLGQKLTLARRASARVAGALLAEGLPRVVDAALDNAAMTESQILKVLAKDDLPGGVAGAIAGHRRWSLLPNVRLALVRQPQTPLARVLAFLPDLTVGDLEVLAGARSLSASLRQYITAEVALRRSRRRTAGLP